MCANFAFNFHYVLGLVWVCSIYFKSDITVIYNSSAFQMCFFYVGILVVKFWAEPDIFVHNILDLYLGKGFRGRGGEQCYFYLVLMSTLSCDTSFSSIVRAVVFGLNFSSQRPNLLITLNLSGVVGQGLACS